jgi:hypothetical protein
VCGIYGSGVSSYAIFGIYCPCYGPSIRPDGRRYFSRYGRYMTPKSPWRVRLLDSKDQNAYQYADYDPVKMAGSAMEQGERALKWLEKQLSAQTCHTATCVGVNVLPIALAALDPELLPEAEEVTEAESFFEGATYSSKVLQQMEGGAGEFHSFPESVKAFEDSGTVTPITGGDGQSLLKLEIPGSYQSSKGAW